MNLWRVLTICLVAAALGCTEKGKPHYTHETAKPEPTGTPLETPATALPSATAVPELKKFEQARDPLKEVVAPFADKVLNLKRVLDPKSLVDRSTREDLLALNHMILNLRPDSILTPQYSVLAHLYASAVVADCGDFKDSCTGLRYFKLAANSSQVVKNFAKISDDHRIRLLLIALELKNKLWDGELVELLLKSTAMDLSESEKADLERAQSLLALAFTSAASRIRDRKEARAFLENMRGWELLTASKIKLEDGARMAMFELAARADYLRDENGQLNPGLKILMDRMESKNNSAFAKQKTLQAQQLFIPEAAGAQYLSKYDELIFLLDGVYTGDIQPQAANVLYKSLNRTSAQLRETMENYVRIHFLSAMFEGTKMIGEIFSAPVESEALLRHAIVESAAITRIWQGFLSQAGPLRSFSMLATAGGDPADQVKIRGMFESLPRTITRSAVYPHMLILFHLLSKKRFEVYMRFSGKAINSATLMRWMFEGKVPPILPYTDDEATLNYFELIHAFDQAVRTGVFSTVKIDVDYFIADTLRRLVEDHNKAIDKTMERARTRLTETLDMRDFRAVCAEFKGGQKRSREFYFGELSQSVYYGKLRPLIYQGMGSENSDTSHSSADSGSVRRHSLGLNYADGDFNEAMEINRLELGSALRAGEGMLAAYNDYLIRFQLPKQGLTGAAAEAEALKLTEGTRNALDQIRIRRKAMLDFAAELHSELGTCYLKAALVDRDLMEKALEYERLYLHHVHSLLTQSRAQGLSPAERAAITKQIQLTGLPGGFTGRDRLTESGFRANQVDLLIRISRYVTQGLNLPGRQLPALAPHLNITFGERLDLDVTAVRDSHEGFVAYVDKPEEFVASTFQLYFRNVRAFIHWKSLNSHPLTMSSEQMKNAVSLYRTEFEINGRSTRISPKQMLNMFEEIMDYVRFTPQEREIMGLTKNYRKFEKIFLDRRFIRTNEGWSRIQDILGLYDFPLQLMTVEQLGYVWDMANWNERMANPPIRQTMFFGGQNFYNTRHSVARGNPIIPFNHAVDKQVDAGYIGFVKSELKAIHTFQEEALKYLGEVGARPANQRPYIDIDIQTPVRDPLYNNNVIQDFRALENNFHRQTNGTFR